MQIRNREINIHRIINYSVMAFVVTFLFIHSLLDIIDQLTRATTHLETQPQIGCNGHPELCDRKYSNITHIATHDAPFVGVLPMENQNVDIPTQLDAGIRFLQAQTHRNVFGKMSLCHTSCLMKDAGLLKDYLKVIKSWLDTHPHEVVTLLLTNGDRRPISEYDAAFRQSNITHYAYNMPPGDPNRWTLDSWPTLGQLIANNTRLLVFLDRGADQIQIPYILNEFSYFWETPFDTLDPLFPSCAIDRPTGLEAYPQSVRQRMYIMNHFLDTKLHVLGSPEVPDRRDAGRTNAWGGEGGVGDHVGRCAGRWGRRPAAVLLDYFDKGDGLKAQRLLNGFA
ncbi:MAG: hypothetical protein LQ350_005036 [Teloschistes chrysophthalmus]|nr:MAG: hypothetical protein LQ350_005036 [Niorma chrysophthalma]